MVPLAALMKVRPSFGPERAMRYNGFPSRRHQRRPGAGLSRPGQAQDAVERIAAETLPPGIGYEWTDLTYQEILAGNSMRSGCSRSRSCSCSWCWPRSTRA